jgi:nucleotide-binding universal stress UspA family protein
VTFAVEAAVRRGLKVTALHIVDDQVLAMTTSSGGAATAQQQRLRELSPALQEARAKYPAVTVTEVIEAGVPSEVIVERGADAALTVVGSRGHGGFKGMLLGSVSRAVIEHVESPVAVVRPAQA